MQILTKRLSQAFAVAVLWLGLFGVASAHTSPTANSMLAHLAHVFGSAHHFYGGLLFCLIGAVAYKVREARKAKRLKSSAHSGSKSS